MVLRLLLLLLLLLLAGCATGPRWSLKPAAEIGGGATRDVALWGERETHADVALECDSAGLRIVLVGTDPHPPEPVTIRAGDAVFVGSLVAGPEDGYGESIVMVPRDHPLLAAIAGGAGSLRFAWGEDRSQLRLGRVPSRFVRSCLRLEGSR